MDDLAWDIHEEANLCVAFVALLPTSVCFLNVFLFLHRSDCKSFHFLYTQENVLASALKFMCDNAILFDLQKHATELW
jgi:hypothetical protein